MYGPALTLGLIVCWVTAATTFINWQEGQRKVTFQAKNPVQNIEPRKRQAVSAERRSV